MLTKKFVWTSTPLWSFAKSTEPIINQQFIWAQYWSLLTEPLPESRSSGRFTRKGNGVAQSPASVFSVLAQVLSCKVVWLCRHSHLLQGMFVTTTSSRRNKITALLGQWWWEYFRLTARDLSFLLQSQITWKRRGKKLLLFPSTALDLAVR